MAIDLVNKILETEKEADEIKKNASAKASAMLIKSKDEAKKMIGEALKKRSDKIAVAIADGANDVKKEIKSMEAKREETLKKITSNAKKRFDKAVEMVLKEVLG